MDPLAVCAGACYGRIGRVGRGGGIVVVVGVAIGQAAKYVVVSKRFIPDQLAKSNVLVSQKGHISVRTILFMAIGRSEEHTSELQSLMRISYAVFCLKKKNTTKNIKTDLLHNTTNNHKQ